MKTPFVLLVGLVVFISGCAVMGGDMLIRVAGSIPRGSAGAERTDCNLNLVLSKSGDVRSHRDVSAVFSTNFVIEARAKQYHFIAHCKDGWEFRSTDFELGGRGTFNKLIELGLMTPSWQGQ